MATFSPGQLRALAIVPKFSSALSLLGSGWIIMEVVRDPRKRAMVYHRLLLAFSAGDVVLSSAYFASTWPIPAGTAGVYGARGTDATCAAQGFFIQVGGVTTLYAAFISVYHLLVVRYRWSEERARGLETVVLTVTLLFALSTAFACLALGLFNFAQFWCWIAPPPDRPEMSVFAYRFAFLYAWLWAGLAVVTASMFLLYWTVRGQVRRMRRYSTLAGRAGANNRRLVATQAMLYVFAFYSIGTFNTLTRIIQAINGRVYFPIVLAMVIFTPLQGFWNLIIYLRPRYLRYREENPEWSKIHVIHRTLHRAVVRNSSSSVRVSGSSAAGGDQLEPVDDGDHMLGVVMESGSGGGDGGDDDETKSPTAVSLVDDAGASATSSCGNDAAETASSEHGPGPEPGHSQSLLHLQQPQQPRGSSPSAMVHPPRSIGEDEVGGDDDEHDRCGGGDPPGAGGRVAAHIAAGTFRLRASPPPSSPAETGRRATTGGISISSDPHSSSRDNRGVHGRRLGDGRLSLRTLSRDEDDDAHRMAVFVGMDGDVPSPGADTDPTAGSAAACAGVDAPDLAFPPLSPADQASAEPAMAGLGGCPDHRSRDDGGRVWGQTPRTASSPPGLDVRIDVGGGGGGGGGGDGSSSRKRAAAAVGGSEDRAVAAAHATGAPSPPISTVAPAAATTEAEIPEDEALRRHHRRWPTTTSPGPPPLGSGDVGRGEDDYELGSTEEPEYPEPQAAAAAAPVPAEASEGDATYRHRLPETDVDDSFGVSSEIDDDLKSSLVKDVPDLDSIPALINPISLCKVPEIGSLDQTRQPDQSVDVETNSDGGGSDNDDDACEEDKRTHRVRARAA